MEIHLHFMIIICYLLAVGQTSICFNLSSKSIPTISNIFTCSKLIPQTRLVHILLLLGGGVSNMLAGGRQAAGRSETVREAKQPRSLSEHRKNPTMLWLNPPLEGSPACRIRPDSVSAPLLRGLGQAAGQTQSPKTLQHWDRWRYK